MRKSFVMIGLAALAMSFTACSDIAGLGGYGSITGSYDLRTFNGSTLPALYFQDSFEQDILVSENFTIYSDGTYTDDYRLRITTQNGTTESDFRDAGTFTQNNTAIQFRDSRTGDVFTGSVTGSTLTINQLGDVYVYQR